MLDFIKKRFVLIVTIVLLLILGTLFLIFDTSLFDNQKTHTFGEALEKQTAKGMLNTKEKDGRFIHASKRDVESSMAVDDRHHNLKHMDISEKVALSKKEINHLLKGKGILEGEGQAFLDAQDKYEVNALYLVSHAQLETGNGESQLAYGLKDGNKRYYNFFGIGAFDENALHHGNSYAKKHNWTSPRKAIMGGAEFVRHHYFENQQLSLYEMRWNPRQPGTHQYASDINWDDNIARYMDRYYQKLGIKKDHIDKDYYKK
ncbi:N-acetylglucosaminidase [Staphylococcus sp. SQ8-PEA]|uniref:N-acetylglucosaminidase n=1 Tax=Staphylococcus marylandisciuri TaxID=2981529 RepID=A0ABT2QML5_9STAP|nr:N-acetylglucosaminidase [Staphylococcus marylandisciuri]MCU5745210.1 N-acetylglucosaminidase [Staphylococcus marylandisciuri]